ncbi:GTP-binding protein [Tistlia consotensis]|uniref:GTPase Der n=1 Tax=Tistlia consotensis USBA 355 TaxID=560819 RepID=A0A1Y6BGF5_9PROT|nr:ribosome biogenesis GTPase Der [Tistlia consotensis]SMF00303.1 GTP-binding protein [Tistlia consotensis USBA 355]SNR75999.1 GTP-binding protein [Tistlia consotensis]
MSFTLAIVGRPNVGKSTLFNRLVGKRLALVDDQPGVTRDRREGDARLFDLHFRVFDTAGLEDVTDDSLEARMRRQTEAAIEQADAALFLVDARAGVTPLDAHFADLMRRARTPVLLAANKCEGKAGEPGLYEAFGLGLGEPIALSAEHGLGMDELYDFLRPLIEAKEGALYPDEDDAEAEADSGEEDEGEEAPRGPVQLAVVGRPNVGKSTLVNRLLGEDRMLTGPEAGITRDSISVDWTWQDRAVRLIDTAGLRRRARIDDKVERLSAADSKRAIDYAQVVVLLLDATLGLEKQDLTIARTVVEEGRALVIALNKWDAVEDRAVALRQVENRLERSFPQTRGIPVVALSALEGRGLDKLMRAVFQAYEIWNKRLATAPLNRWLQAVSAQHPPPAPGGRRIRLKYMTQARSRPPTFAIHCSNPDDLPPSYLRYLENQLRLDFDMPGTPIRIHLKKQKNPYADG